MKKDWEYKFWDDYYDRCAEIWRPDLTSSDPEKRRMAEHMVKSMEEAKQHEYTAVKHPSIKGHSVVLRHKRGEPRPKAYFEEEVELPKVIELPETLEAVAVPKLPWYKRIWARIKNF